MIRLIAVAFAAVLLPSWTCVSFAAEPGDCLSTEEAALLQAINDYRVTNGHAAVPWSKSLTEVAQWHVWDLETNRPDAPSDCNLHSWSDQGSWTEVCYTDDHFYLDLMWSKPSEITGGVYGANGYENSYWASAGATAAGALATWQASSGHNDVILNLGDWASRDPWPAMGAGMLAGYAVLWFGDAMDPSGTISVCGSDVIFSDGFEAGHTDSWTTTVQ